MKGPLTDKRIILGVTGSIACYKAVDLASKLVQAGAVVDTILTHGATQFVTALTFRSITHRPVVTDTFDVTSEFSVEHVTLAHSADLMVVAPTTVHTIAKLALGLADDPLTTTAIATTAPIIIAPAMDANMFDNPATQKNISTLIERGITICGPAPGRLASGIMGMGRLIEPAELLGHITSIIGQQGDLAGKTVVISAGGTQEPIDPVRMITNRSSGKMGYALAEASRDRGATVILITAPTALPTPAATHVIQVKTAQEMCDAVLNESKKADVLIMAAAVADYKPVNAADQKIKKSEDHLNIELTKTVDILEASPANMIKVGFSAESENLIDNAKSKVSKKSLDLIVANDITDPDSGFGIDTNKVVLIDRDHHIDALPVMSKYRVSHHILDRVVSLL